MKTVIVGVTQARIGSSRLPGKVLKMVEGKSFLQLHLERLLQIQGVDRIMVATTHEPGAEAIVELARKLGCLVYQGSTEDVLDRFYQAVLPLYPTSVLRFTSDCPLIDPRLVEDLILRYKGAGCDYASNCLKPTLPDGMDAEIMSFAALESSWEEARLPSEREHVTPFIRNHSAVSGGNRFKVLSVEYAEDFSKERLTLDTAEDAKVLEILIQRVGQYASWKEYVKFLQEHQDVRAINHGIQRNEGLLKSLKNDVVKKESS